MSATIKIPKTWPVQPLKQGQDAEDKATCGGCGLSWDDGKITSMTPAPAGRCPFEQFHIIEKEKPLKTHLCIVSFIAECCNKTHAEATRLTAKQAADPKMLDRIKKRYAKNGIEVDDCYIIKGEGK